LGGNGKKRTKGMRKEETKKEESGKKVWASNAICIKWCSLPARDEDHGGSTSGGCA
jgi:hypothetical protein